MSGMRLLVTMNLNSIAVPMLACGPGPELIFFFYALLGAGAVCACFLWGIICLFTKMRTLGVCLITFSLLAVGAGLAWLGVPH